MSSPSPTSRLVRGRRTTALLVTFFLVLALGVLAVPASDAATTSSEPAALTVRIAERGATEAVLSWELDKSSEMRRVELQRRTPHTQWRTVRETSVEPGGHRFVVRPSFLGRFHYRLHAPATDRLAAASSPAVRYARAVGYRPRGRAHQHSSLFAEPARWNPCRTITWRANLEGAWPGALRNLKKAVRRTAWASGLTFRYAGRTDVVPDGTLHQPYPAGTDLVVAWARPGTTPLLPRESRSLLGTGGGVTWGGVVDELGRPAREIRTGRVVISTRAARLAPGFGPRATRGALLMHELGHAVGLGHVSARGQLMHPLIRRGADRWGRGDLRGLAVRGMTRGCLTAAPSLRSSTARLAADRPESADLH